jgi:hypothetical protein
VLIALLRCLVSTFDILTYGGYVHNCLPQLKDAGRVLVYPLQHSGHFSPVNACRIIVQRTDPDLLESHPCQI